MNKRKLMHLFLGAGIPLQILFVCILMQIESPLWKLVVGVIHGVVSLGFLSWLLQAHVLQPLDIIQKQLSKVDQGSWSWNLRSPPELSLELTELNKELQKVAFFIENKLEKIFRQKRERKALLDNMVEGVMAISIKEEIFQMNRAAADFLGVGETQFKGRNYHDLIQSHQIKEVIKRALASHEAMDEEIRFWDGLRTQYISIRATPFRDGHGDVAGAIFMFHDVTRLRELEEHRRTFVGNVAHELKTPLTLIQGCVETLLDTQPKTAIESEHFLHVIKKHSLRLSQIIEDLLVLSRLEHGDKVETQTVRMKSLISSAIQTCEVQAKSKNVRLSSDLPGDLMASVNAPLIEQALINLIDNAIKYSPAGSQVQVFSRTHPQGGIELGVEDQGEGIPEDDQVRIFERFYRVDKARSRKQGGTGLGLSIVKHIAIAHHGRVSVSSKLHEGSRFIIHLPSPSI